MKNSQRQMIIKMLEDGFRLGPADLREAISVAARLVGRDKLKAILRQHNFARVTLPHNERMLSDRWHKVGRNASVSERNQIADAFLTHIVGFSLYEIESFLEDHISLPTDFLKRVYDAPLHSRQGFWQAVSQVLPKACAPHEIEKMCQADVDGSTIEHFLLQVGMMSEETTILTKLGDACQALRLSHH